MKTTNHIGCLFLIMMVLITGGCSKGGKSAKALLVGITLAGVETSNTLHVTITKDLSRSTSTLISAALGGSISTTAQDGTVYTLTIPPDALVSDETITLTPVTAVDGMPLSGGLSGAVNFEPDGLSLLEPATLEIQFTGPVSTADAISFQYIGNGSDCFLIPEMIDGSTVSLQINHFSGAGNGKGTDEDRARTSSYTPASAEDQFFQDLNNLRVRARKEGRSPTNDEYEPIARRWNDSIRMRLNVAASDKGMDFPCLVAEFLRWDKTLNPLSNTLRDRFVEAISGCLDLIKQGYDNAVNKSYGRCKDGKDPYEAGRLIQLEQVAKNVNSRFTTFGSPFLDVSLADNKLNLCAVFEVTFDSELVHSLWNACSGGDTSHMKATQKVYLDPSLGVSVFSSLAESNVEISHDWQFSDCTLYREYVPGSFKVLEMWLNLNTILECGQAAGNKDVMVRLNYSLSGGNFTGLYYNHHKNVGDKAHWPDESTPYFWYEAFNFSKDPAGGYGYRMYTGRLDYAPDNYSTEITTLVITHTPL